MEPKKTPLYEKHAAAQGKIVDFAGWLLPVEYASSLKEAKACRTTCGLFDASHMGEIRIKGPNALEFLQSLTTNDISITQKGQQQYNLFLNPQGGIIDDLMVYNDGDGLWCVVNASNKDKCLKWLLDNKKPGVEIIDESEQTALLPLQGPTAVDIVKALTGAPVEALKYMHFDYFNVQGARCLISRSGYTGEDGFEIYLPAKNATTIWDAILAAGKNYGLTLCGLGSRDILRVEAGYPLYGHEISDSVDPYSANLGWAVKLNKDFIAKEKLVKIKTDKPKMLRFGFIMQDRSMPRQGYNIFDGSSLIGQITSGVFSPNLEKFVGMASLTAVTQIGKDVAVEIRNSRYSAKVVKFPFIEIKTKQKLAKAKV